MENVISTSLCHAARMGHLDEMQRLIHAGHHVRNADNRGYTPLHEAVKAGHEDCAELLLQEEDCDPNAQTHEGYSPLYLACKFQNQPSLIVLLVNYGADCNLADKEDITPLHVVCSENKLELLRALLYHQADITREDFDGLTPFHEAVCHAHLEVMQELLDRGASVDERDAFGRSALYVAAEMGWKQGAAVLLQHGFSVNSSTRDGFTPLMAACQGNYEDIVLLLLEHGADPNLEANSGQLALSLAVHTGYPSLVKLMLNNTSRDVVVRNSSRAPQSLVSLPCLAIDSGSSTCLAMILEYEFGAPVNNAPIRGSLLNSDVYSYSWLSPLGFLLRDNLSLSKSEEMLDLLLEKGVPVNARSVEEMPPVVGLALSECNKASRQSFTQLKLHFLQKLLRNGCNIDYSSMANGIPDAVLSTILYSDLEQNETMVRVLYESSLSCNANQILAWLWNNAQNVYRRILKVLREHAVAPYSWEKNPQHFQASFPVQSLQEISRTAVRQWLWNSLGDSSSAKYVLDAHKVPLPVQRYIIGHAWIKALK